MVVVYIYVIVFVEGGKLTQCCWRRWVLFPFSKGGTTSFKLIYKCHRQQWGIYFHSFLKVPQLSLNITSVVDNNEFSML
jgi:hypothetical protein